MPQTNAIFSIFVSGVVTKYIHTFYGFCGGPSLCQPQVPLAFRISPTADTSPLGSTGEGQVQCAACAYLPIDTSVAAQKFYWWCHNMSVAVQNFY